MKENYAIGDETEGISLAERTFLASPQSQVSIIVPILVIIQLPSKTACLRQKYTYLRLFYERAPLNIE